MDFHDFPWFSLIFMIFFDFHAPVAKMGLPTVYIYIYIRQHYRHYRHGFGRCFKLFLVIFSDVLHIFMLFGVPGHLGAAPAPHLAFCLAFTSVVKGFQERPQARIYHFCGDFSGFSWFCLISIVFRDFLWFSCPGGQNRPPNSLIIHNQHYRHGFTWFREVFLAVFGVF